jgi:hypothetical protein
MRRKPIRYQMVKIGGRWYLRRVGTKRWSPHESASAAEDAARQKSWKEWTEKLK